MDLLLNAAKFLTYDECEAIGSLIEQIISKSKSRILLILKKW